MFSLIFVITSLSSLSRITRTNVIVIIIILPSFSFSFISLEALFLYPLLAIICEHLERREKFDFLLIFLYYRIPSLLLFFNSPLQLPRSFSRTSLREKKNGVSNVSLLPCMCTRLCYNYHEPRSAFEIKCV